MTLAPAAPQREDLLLGALNRRLTAAWPHLVGGDLPAVPDGDVAVAAAALLGHAVDALGDRPGDDRIWLLLTAVTGAFPTAEACARIRRVMHLGEPGPTLERLLVDGHQLACEGGAAYTDIDVVTDAVLVDVTLCAKHDMHTGIQRTVRATMPFWATRPGVRLVAWNEDLSGYRDLDVVERSRVLHWGSPLPPRSMGVVGQDTLIVPWRSRLVLSESPPTGSMHRLATIGQMSGNAVVAIGYDCIPVVSPDTVHGAQPEHFVRLLNVYKHADVIAGISRSATEEFAGFADMLPAQGVRPPRVVEVMLPVSRTSAIGDGATDASRDTVLCVGSFEPRKNQGTVLLAAERLWREGHTFRLRFVGGSGYRTEFDDVFDRLRAAGRDVSRRQGITDAELSEAYDRSRFTVFVSLHEGYGLPVAESLAHGVPVLATDFGSTAEIAADGGALLVDPRDDEAVLAAMRRLLTDDDLVSRLRAEALARPTRTWADYADELWDVLCGPGAAA